MSKALFYMLSFTWGIVMTIVGYLTALVLILMGHKPNGKYGYCLVFEIGRNWGGLSLGPVIIKDKSISYYVLKHEHGHAIQNCWFGPLFPIIVGIPSAVRYWWRELMMAIGKDDLPDYDSIWFEGQATRIGTKFIQKHFGG